jgi:hypothetical protein
MAAAPVPWKEIAGCFELDFGTTSLTDKGRKLLRVRGTNHLPSRTPPTEVETGRNETTSLEARDWGEFDLSLGSAGIDLGTPNKPIVIFHDPTKYCITSPLQTRKASCNGSLLS